MFRLTPRAEHRIDATGINRLRRPYTYRLAEAATERQNRAGRAPRRVGPPFTGRAYVLGNPFARGKVRTQRSRLVVQHVERMSGRILDEHPHVIREYVRGKRGIYALYRRSKLYYVGLASDLRRRLKAHLRDRHAGKWDWFSLYLTETLEHLRELEALALRITMPQGNKSKTQFAGSRDLRRYFKRKIKEAQSRELSELFGPSRSERKGRRARQDGRSPTLGGYVDSRTPIRMRYHKKVYKATVQPDGSIRFKGKYFTSPSSVASAVSKRPMNGWSWWRYEVAPGEWVELKQLRRGK